ncbi:pentapeptide repeat-containing protein [Merismopedia glauca]|uniref:Pentapeptide repeat-containing protein n=1 Tax=Merismopedia glauca CCAP 1448/3 TaxID=1296344 RepID=A0A2T1CA72_9CYAN|nr:pentapeptide repeat-containing protein [Merismopedia glauca]PSB05047.1 pentapeptide repeat-containing protein [Merismopedia glauca CCAP 1448/3]
MRVSSFKCFTAKLFKALLILTVAITIWLHLQPAQAFDKMYPPPLSFSNAQLMGKDFSGQYLASSEFSNANLVQANFSNADLHGAIFSHATMNGANLHGADLTNGMADLVNFADADLTDAVLVDVILLRTAFYHTKIEGADFTNAILDGLQVKQLCAIASGVNSKTGVATRDSLGCK